MEICFNFDQVRYAFDRDVVIFQATVDGVARFHAITGEALRDWSDNSDKASLLAVFHSMTAIIIENVEAKLLAGDLESDGSVLLRSADLA